MSDSKTENNQLERLQKVLAASGIGSRRQCEELILEGRVDVDREIVTQLGTRVDPSKQAIRVDGVTLKRKRRQYFVVHKPPGVVSTSNDQWRRTRVIDLVDSKSRVFTIGRLDKESSGLILVTNDGELANRLTHPRYQVPKTYHVTVAGVPSTEVLHKLRRGVVLSDGPVKPDSIRIKRRQKQASVLEIVLTEGRNREIRRMLARFDHKVLTLHRVAIGPIRLGELPKSAHRELSTAEVKKLLDFGQAKSKKKRRTTTKKKKATKKSGTKTGAKPTKKKSGSSKKSKRKIGADMAPRMGAVLGGDDSSQRKSKPSTSKNTKSKASRRKSTKRGRK